MPGALIFLGTGRAVGGGYSTQPGFDLIFQLGAANFVDFA